MRKALIVLLLVAMAITLGTSVAVFTQLPAPAQKFTVPPENGCVGCHDGKLVARKLSDIMKAWKDKVPDLALDIGKKAGGKDLTGKHPDVAASVAKEELPTFCLTCHAAPDAKGAKGVILSRDMHLLKYSTAMAAFSCTACHVLDLSNGDMKLKTGKE